MLHKKGVTLDNSDFKMREFIFYLFLINLTEIFVRREPDEKCLTL